MLALPGVLGVLAAPLFIMRLGLSTTDVVLFLGMYAATQGAGLSVGYHRHFSHGAFETYRPLQLALAVLGAMAGQGPLTYWVAIHRRHHEHGDEAGDPHSPHGFGDGAAATLRGLWHAHFGWSLQLGMPSAAHYCPHLLRDPALVAIGRAHRRWVLLGLLLPTAAGALLAGVRGAAGGLLWGGLVRLFVSSNSTWSLNSICHRFGSRPFPTRDRSANNAWLALVTLGESWHNNHHAFPSSAFHGLRPWQLDLNGAFIRLLELLGLAWSVKRVPRRAGPTGELRSVRTGSR